MQAKNKPIAKHFAPLTTYMTVELYNALVWQDAGRGF